MSEKDKKEKPEKKDKEEREREKEREKEEKEREKEREKQRERALYIERQNEKLYRREKKEDDKKREKELEKERERDKEREKEQEKEKHKLEKKEKKEHEKEQKEKDKEHKDKDKEQKEKDKEKDKEHKEKDKEKKDKDKEKDKEQKEKDKQKQKEKKEKDKEKEKDKKKDKNKQKDKNEKGDKALAAQAKQLETANGNDYEKANETKVTVIDPSKFDRLPESVVAGLVNITESDHLGPALKSIFESGKERETIDNLNSYVQRKQGEIEEICSENYQEFINSVNELLEVRQDTRQMREAIISINKDTQSDAAFVLERAQALSAKRKERQRIEAAIMATRGLQHVISVCMQIDEYIKANSFYPALRLLDQVQRVYLRKGLAGDGPLFRVLEAHVPKLRTKIKKQVTEEFNDWLVLVRQKCEEVGSLAMHPVKYELLQKKTKIEQRVSCTWRESQQMEGQIEREHAMNPLKRTEHGWDIQEVDRKVQPPLDFQQGEVEQPLFEKVEIDFLPLYRCIHIHEYLGAKPEFATYYKENRRLQALLVLKERVTEVTEPYFHQIAGFFIVENTVLETSTLVPRAVVESLWDYAVAKMKAVLQEQFAYVQSPEVLKKIKSFVFCFASTLRSYSYDVSSLTGFLDTLKEKYTELSVAKFVEDFQHMVEEDKLEPLKVTTLDEHERLIKANRLDVPLDQREEEPVNNNLANSSGLGPPSTPLVGSSSRRRLTDEELPSLPQDYWFSIIVPQFYDHVRKFIMEFYEFASDLSDTDQYIIKSTDNLIKSLSQILVTTIDQANNVPQLVQTITNTLYILKSVNFFGDFLGRWTRAGGRVTLLSARKQLENAIASGEKRIVELGDQKLDELMTTAANITWLPVSASTMPRDYIQDIILYLNTTLAFTEQLSSQLKEEIATRAFKRVGDAMLGMLLGTQGVPFKKFNIAAIKSLDVDLVEIETFAREKTTLLKTSKNLAIYFGELRQIVSLLLSDNMEEFLDPKIRSKNYPLISNLPQLVSLLQKFKEESQGFFSAKDPKMVQINILIKKLKELN